MNLSLATRIFLGYVVVLLPTFGAVSIFGVVQMHSIGRDIRLVSEGYLPLTKVVAQIESFHKNRQGDTDRVFAEQAPDLRAALIRLAQVYYPQLMRERVSAARTLLGEIRERAPKSETEFLGGMEDRLEELSTLLASYQRACSLLFETIAATGLADRGSEPAREVVSLERRIDREIKLISTMLDQRVAERVRTADERERWGAWLVIALSLVAIALGLSATLVAGRLLAPIRDLTAMVTRVGHGDYAAQAPASARGELALLAREFGALARGLAERERELAEKQEALVRAERLAAIGRVSAQITHEIRNPLSSIGLNTEMLQESLESARFESERVSEEARHLVASIGREADRLTEITDQYLKFARFPKPTLEPEDPNALLEDLLGFLDEEHARADVKVVRALAAACPKVVADAGQLRQALMNLLRNSREALVHGGTITVTTRPLVTMVEIEVADDGPGMPPADLARLFDPFFSTKERGTGLGLALTQQIILEHGGEIRCESEVGKGTRFILRLRRAREGGAP